MKAMDELLEEMSGEGKDVLLLIRELAGFVSYYRRVLELFELDMLTGLPGSNKYHEFKASLSERPTESLGAIVFDVNDLKYYNDNKGHQAGDLLLQKAAESFHFICGDNDCGRSCDIGVNSKQCVAGPVCKNIRVFRTGGDEFVALIPGCSESDLLEIIGKWKEKLAELNGANDGITCNVAYGAAFGSGDYKFGDVLQLADERMYAEKRRMKECGVKMGEVR